ncbi:MAG: ABC transporter ATP-binding protein/permease [Defluviitaleaceae bacterium]|nr:ABC transporter ATP-binding protein/permease [Defluviitaleaceae bacterium]
MLTLFKEARPGAGKVMLLALFLTMQIVGTLYLPRLTARIINNGVITGDRDYVFSVGAIMLGVAIFTGIASVLSTYYSAWVSTLFAKNTRARLFKHTQKLSYQDYRHFSTSSLITRATNDIEQLQSTIGMVFEMMLPAPFVFAFGLTLAYRSDPFLALILFIVSAVLLVIFVVAVKWVLPLFTKVQLGLDKINERVAQYISGIRVIRAFNRTKLETERMGNTFDDFAKVNIKINRAFAAIVPLAILIMSLATVAIVWFGGIRINRGYMQIGDITAVLEYGMIMLMYLMMAVFTAIFLPRAKVCAGRVREVLEYMPEISDGKEHINSDKPLRLEFNNVGFRYLDAENPLLHELNFTCEKGTTTAIIGGTGSGKSTLARMIPRLLDASGGEVLLNGVNIKNIPQEELRERVGFVPQKAFLFSGTIADNMRHGNPDATVEDMQTAAQTAQAADFINELPEKFDAEVKQGGRNFSGGQRQRLSIARMLMKQPEIYVFDDSFSALDFKTDAALRSALKKVTKNSIVINVAQRITTIMDADQILVIDEGKIVGKGTHRELLHNNEVYLEIAKSQLSEEELNNELRK